MRHLAPSLIQSASTQYLRPDPGMQSEHHNPSKQNKPHPPENLIWDAGGSILNVLLEGRGMERNILIRVVTHYTIINGN